MIQGRLLAVRAKRAQSDLCHISAYFPLPSTQHANRIVKKMLAWMNKIFENLPLRCLPYIYMDLNSGVGVEKNDCIESNIESKALGPFNRAKENFVGTAVRTFLEKWDMFLPMTASKQIPTFYSITNHSMSHIDHIAVPLSVWENSELQPKCSVWLRSGRNIQLIKSIFLADHLPVCVSHKKAVYIVLSHMKRKSVDRDSLMKCLLYGHKRGTLV